MGIVQLLPVIIGNYVWFDDNGNGIQEPTEAGVPDVELYLYDELTEQVMTDDRGRLVSQTTDKQGEYLFTDLAPGRYRVIFNLRTLPEGYVVSPADQEPSDTADSDATQSTGSTPPTDMLSHGDIDRTLDMGIYYPVQVQGTVWLDSDSDGQQDAEEAGLSGVSVGLYQAETAEWVADVTTDFNGSYLFEKLSPSNYYVVFNAETFPANYLSSTLRSDDTGFLHSGEQSLIPGLDLVESVEIGGKVWGDENMDGIQDENEASREPNISVTLYDARTDTPIATTTTDSQGAYAFSGLRPGKYSVAFDLASLPEGYVVTQANATSDPLNSDVNPADGRTGSTDFLSSRTAFHTLDMGIHLHAKDLVRIGGQLWEDSDLDDQVDASEHVWSEITVALYSQDDPTVDDPAVDDLTVPVATTLTDEDGYFFFGDLPSGEYFVTIPADSLPKGTLPPRNYSTGTSDDQRINLGILDQGEEVLNLNMVLNYPGALSGGAWIDGNGDGIESSDELTLSGVTVLLYDDRGEVVDKAETDANGAYHFENMLPGEYRIEYVNLSIYSISPKRQGNDPAIDSDADPTTGLTAILFVGSGAHVADIDAGFYEGGAITDLFWLDLDGNGVLDPDEEGIPGVRVLLRSGAGKLVSETVTDANGRYGFADLPAGEYYIDFELPEEMIAAIELLDGGLNLVHSPMISVGLGRNISAVNVGFTQPSAIGNYVWLDENRNGMADEDEAGVAAVTVHLLDAQGNLLESTITDSDGRFEFVVRPGDYQLEFISADGLTFTTNDQGDDRMDSDVDPTTGRTQVISVSPGTSDFSYFAGFTTSPISTKLIRFSASQFLPSESAADELQYAVRAEWLTESEFGTLGFEVYRSQTERFEGALKVTEDIILAHGGDSSYEFVDTSVGVDQVYSYWLVEVQNDQQTYHYGPARVMVEGIQTTAQYRMIFLPLIQK